MSNTFAEKRVNNEQASRDIAADQVRSNSIHAGVSTPVDLSKGDTAWLTAEDISYLNNAGPDGETTNIKLVGIN
jgi:hypothetical protein